MSRPSTTRAAGAAGQRAEPDTSAFAKATDQAESSQPAKPDWPPLDGAFGDALKAHFPSREALLAEARAQTQARSERLKKARTTTGRILPVVLLGVVFWADPVWNTQEVRTSVGEQTRLSLADGSQVMLNSASVLLVERRLRTRQLVLQSGEAAFTVAASWQPFIVRSGDYAVRDISTAFTVAHTAGTSRVTVLEGAVEVAPQATGLQAMLPWAMQPSVLLAQGQSLAIQDATDSAAAHIDLSQVESVDLQRASAWQNGRIVFDGTPLAEAAAQLQRYLPETLLVSEEVAALRVSGVYDIQRLQQFINRLPDTLPVAVQRESGDAGARIRIEAAVRRR